jgi:hypothetical protein
MSTFDTVSHQKENLPEEKIPTRRSGHCLTTISWMVAKCSTTTSATRSGHPLHALPAGLQTCIAVTYIVDCCGHIITQPLHYWERNASSHKKGRAHRFRRGVCFGRRHTPASTRRNLARRGDRLGWRSSCPKRKLCPIVSVPMTAMLLSVIPLLGGVIIRVLPHPGLWVKTLGLAFARPGGGGIPFGVLASASI